MSQFTCVMMGNESLPKVFLIKKLINLLEAQLEDADESFGLAVYRASFGATQIKIPIH